MPFSKYNKINIWIQWTCIIHINWPNFKRSHLYVLKKLQTNKIIICKTNGVHKNSLALPFMKLFGFIFFFKVFIIYIPIFPQQMKIVYLTDYFGIIWSYPYLFSSIWTKKICIQFPIYAIILHHCGYDLRFQLT